MTPRHALNAVGLTQLSVRQEAAEEADQGSQSKQDPACEGRRPASGGLLPAYLLGGHI